MRPARVVQPLFWRLATRVRKWDSVAGLLQVCLSLDSKAVRNRSLGGSLLARLSCSASMESPGTNGSVTMEFLESFELCGRCLDREVRGDRICRFVLGCMETRLDRHCSLCLCRHCEGVLLMLLGIWRASIQARAGLTSVGGAC